MVGFAAGEINGLADVAFGVGGVEDAVDADHGKNEYFFQFSNFRQSILGKI